MSIICAGGLEQEEKPGFRQQRRQGQHGQGQQGLGQQGQQVVYQGQGQQGQGHYQGQGQGHQGSYQGHGQRGQQGQQLLYQGQQHTAPDFSDAFDGLQLQHSAKGLTNQVGGRLGKVYLGVCLPLCGSPRKVER